MNAYVCSPLKKNEGLKNAVQAVKAALSSAKRQSKPFLLLCRSILQFWSSSVAMSYNIGAISRIQTNQGEQSSRSAGGRGFHSMSVSLILVNVFVGYRSTYN